MVWTLAAWWEAWSLYLAISVGIIWVVSCLAVLAFVVSCRYRAHGKRQARRRSGDNSTTLLAFFHPFCSSGGGGERVLWKMVQVLLDRQRNAAKTDGDQKRVQILIYTVDEPSPTHVQDLLKHVKDRFSIDLTQREMDAENSLRFVHLHQYKHYLLPAKRLSLLVESFRTMQLAWKAMTYGGKWDLMPDVFVDTTGCAFTFVVARLLMGCQVWAYVHYPTISTDMLKLVWERRRAAYNHASYISRSKVATYVKLLYYCVFAFLYGMTGSLARVVLVNSTWTFNHIQSLWKWAAWNNFIEIVYPPCQVSDLQQREPQSPPPRRQNVILSIGQFRPEKDHVLQIEAVDQFLCSHPEWKGRIKLVLIGSCRGESDNERLEYLKGLAKAKNWNEDTIEFVVNQHYSVIQQWLSKASMGIHTMWNEHFGIGIVEMMAAGLIVMAHNSGGPQTDIVTTFTASRSGFLASTAQEYAACMHEILEGLNPKEIERIRERARSSALRFSDEVFDRKMKQVFNTHLP